ncbi:hypothetical protein Ancab_014274, partial [Ancistrocladus abbreviatus]
QSVQQLSNPLMSQSSAKAFAKKERQSQKMADSHVPAPANQTRVPHLPETCQAFSAKENLKSKSNIPSKHRSHDLQAPGPQPVTSHFL